MKEYKQIYQKFSKLNLNVSRIWLNFLMPKIS